jgi:hypothetical protein
VAILVLQGHTRKHIYKPQNKGDEEDGETTRKDELYMTSLETFSNVKLDPSMTQSSSRRSKWIHGSPKTKIGWEGYRL